MSQSSDTNEIKDLETKDEVKENNTNNILNDEITKELNNINLKLGTIEKKIDKITPGNYALSWRDFEK